MSPIYNNVGESIQSFYQTMDNQGWEALQWTKNNTARNAVFVTDALYGWWLGGFAQRPTLSAMDPQFLSLNREVDNATFARNILDTDYMIDNGYLQVAKTVAIWDSITQSFQRNSEMNTTRSRSSTSITLIR